MGITWRYHDRMSGTQTLIQILKTELKAAGVTYATLATELGMAESSVKRMFAKGDMPLVRLDEICRVLKMDFTELARQVAAQAPMVKALTEAQEQAVVADRRLLLVAICCMSQWTVAQMQSFYTLSEAELIRYLVALDRLDIIELRPGNRYRLKLAKGFRWRPDGPVMRYFRGSVVGDFYEGGFDGEGELLMLVHGSIAKTQAAHLVERLERLGQDFAQQGLLDQKLPESQRASYTLIVGMRSWLFAAFRDLQRG